jgi:hypothetical protein
MTLRLSADQRFIDCGPEHVFSWVRHGVGYSAFIAMARKFSGSGSPRARVKDTDLVCGDGPELLEHAQSLDHRSNARA